MTGKFIVFEGIDGSGKSTHAKILSEWLNSNGIKTLHTKEPSQGKIGILLRDYLKVKTSSGRVDALLFTADRAEHLEQDILPAMKRGEVVVCERYKYSTIAYQTTQGEDTDWLIGLNEFAREPDLVILMDLEPSVALKRSEEGEKFEALGFLTKTRKNYMKFSDHFTIVDASKSKDEVQEELRRIVGDFLNL
nr:dTMP kinase [Candidatus Undinarchaeales archaeon ERR594346 U_76725]